MENENFIFYKSWLDNIAEEYADPKIKSELILAIATYGIYGIQTFPTERMFLKQCYAQIDTAKKKYETKIENGKKGGAPKGNKNAVKEGEKQTKKTTENNQKQPKTTKVEKKQPKTTKVEKKQPKTTKVGKKQPKTTKVEKKQPNDNDNVNANDNVNDNGNGINIIISNLTKDNVNTNTALSPLPLDGQVSGQSYISKSGLDLTKKLTQEEINTLSEAEWDTYIDLHEDI